MDPVETREAWPFLVASGKYRGYQAVIAPRFLVETQLAGMVEEVAGSGGQVSQHGEAYLRFVEAPEGDFLRSTVVYRAVTVTGNLVGEDTDIATDEYGRYAVFFEGIVLRDLFPGMLFCAEVFERTRQTIMAVFPKYWYSRGDFPVVPSEPFLLHRAPCKSPVTRLVELPTYHAAPKQGHVNIEDELTSKNAWLT